MKTRFVGKEEWGGLAPSQPRKDLTPPRGWRLEIVAAMERPHHLVVGPDGRTIAFVLDRSDLGSDVWVASDSAATPERLTVDRPPTAFWEDTVPAISPDGRSVAYVGGGGVRIVPLEGGPSRLLIEAGSPVWLPDGRLIVSIEQDRSRAEAQHPRSTAVSRLAVVETSDPWAHPITAADGDAAQATPSPDGTMIAYTWFPPDDRNRSDIRIADLKSGSTSTVASVAATHAHSPAWSPDGARVAYVSEESGWYQVCLARATGEDARTITDGEGDFSSLRWSPRGDLIVALRSLRGRTDLVTVDMGSGATEVKAAGGDWQDPQWLADGSIVAVFEDHSTPPRIEVVTPSGTRQTAFDPAPTALRTVTHVTPEEIWYESSDGLQIHGFLFRPEAASDATPVPAVVYPHGGPTSAYTDAWDGHAQYFLDKGYAWFAINFRGSTTYGREFERANHGVWGVLDTEDCLAAADFLADLSWVDARRLAIFGASYGSYMALCSLVLDPRHRFACGVAKYGDCDILTSWAQGDRVGTEDLERQMGHPSDQPAGYRAGSPIHQIDRIQRPILIAHGEQDERVHPKQSEELVAALERHAKTYEYVTYPTEGHGLLRLGPQLDFYRRLERFLDWYLM